MEVSYDMTSMHELGGREGAERSGKSIGGKTLVKPADG